MSTIVRSAFGVMLAAVTAVACQALEHDIAPAATTAASGSALADINPAYLYGRIVTDSGDTYEGRLRWGRDEEAFWGDYFNGTKDGNPWVRHLPEDLRPLERRPIEIFGFKIPDRTESDVRRPFMARFGDIARIDAHGFKKVRVTLKSGTVVDLDRLAANDFDDGVRVWDATRGVVDLASWAGGIPPPSRRRIRAIEFLATARPGTASDRLHGTVRTRHGDFTGFVQWDRQASVGDDALEGRAADQDLSVRFATIRAIARRSPDSAVVTLLDGGEIEMSGTRDVGDGSRGMYVDDQRFGRVLISWDAFERIDFSPGGGGPAYGEFPPGRPLRGTITTRIGRRLTGRIVYDLDESEICETLDAPAEGVDYTIPFGLIASIVPGVDGRPSVTLHNNERLKLERAGDLGAGNAGLLVFVDGGAPPEYIPWIDVAQIDFERPVAMYPSLGGR
jgi:hypothetical protein